MLAENECTLLQDEIVACGSMSLISNGMELGGSIPYWSKKIH